MKFGYYILNTYVPELDGDSASVYGRWLEQIDAAESQIRALVNEGHTLTEARAKLGYHKLQTKR